ncbi:MAG TPA: alkaline phosphatase family protein [Solirubrobacteraceae bacterium]|nr:alkaline phosphatase family protein [Solirubrobacteraceae bacterium]
MPSSDSVTRRTLLRGAAGGAALLAAHGLPAWARPVAATAGIRRPDSLPFPSLKAGTPSMPQIDHIVVLIMENHSFDNLLGMVPYQVPGRSKVDGLTRAHGRFLNVNADASGHQVFAQHAASPCQLSKLPGQDWNRSHTSWDNGRNDGFVRASGPIAMRFWDESDLPFTYSLVAHFPIGQRFFCSTLCQTYPNRRFFFTGTASGTIATDNTTFSIPAANGTIWDRLDAHNIDWAIYYQDLPSWLIVPGSFSSARASRQRKFPAFLTDVAAGRLPQFTFLDPNYTTTSEENPQDIQVGEQFIAQVVHALMRAPTWKRTALFITYDEHGGYYDHVPPPRAIKPDSIPPMTTTGDLPGGYDRYGFRVPLIVVSPWARADYVSSVTQDHTSITAFIERKWNLPAMTYRDANAAPMTDYFDFSDKPAFAKPPRLAAAPSLAPGLAKCHAHGLTPPLPNTPASASDVTDVSRYLRGR